MHTWELAHLDTSETLAAGTRPSRCEAWASAITEAMNLLTTGVLDRFQITVDDQPALLIAGRDTNGQPDPAATRAAVERMAAACCGVPL